MGNEKFMTSIGGQAIMEGVMMRGPEVMAMSVRMPDGSIETEIVELKPPKWYQKVPFLRGTFNFIDSMMTGYKCMSWSSEKTGLGAEEELTPFERKLKDKLGDKFFTVLMGFAMVLGMALAIFLFVVMPTILVKWLSRFVDLGGWKAVIEGVIRLILFVLYIWIVAKMEEIHRVYQYHGAEHKSIMCYEMGEEVTPENAMKQVRLHPRCGTSFIFISLMISIIVSSFITWDTVYMRVILKLLMLPVVLGISYEIIRYAGRHDNWFSRAMSYPGLQLQRITTAEPDEEMLEVAIVSLKAAMPKEAGKDHIE